MLLVAAFVQIFAHSKLAGTTIRMSGAKSKFGFFMPLAIESPPR